jgi:hypothetical protein
MNTEALHQLKRVLGEVQAKSKPFDMRFWVGDQATYDVLSGPEITCGTSSCAAGWAARDPWFKEHRFTILNGNVSYHNALGFTACARFFDISNETSEFLFSEPNTLEEVLDHIAQVLSGKYPEE